MARLNKKPDQLRNETIEIRVTETEKATIKAIAKDRGMNTSDYLRGLALHTALTRPGKTTLPGIDRELLIKLKGEIGKLGNNVNQIAREINRRNKMGDPQPIPDHIIASAFYGVDTMMRHLLEVFGYGH